MEATYFLIKATFKFINMKGKIQGDERISTFWGAKQDDVFAIYQSHFHDSVKHECGTENFLIRKMKPKEIEKWQATMKLPEF